MTSCCDLYPLDIWVAIQLRTTFGENALLKTCKRLYEGIYQKPAQWFHEIEERENKCVIIRLPKNIMRIVVLCANYKVRKGIWTPLGGSKATIMWIERKKVDKMQFPWGGKDIWCNMFDWYCPVSVTFCKEEGNSSIVVWEKGKCPLFDLYRPNTKTHNKYVEGKKKGVLTHSYSQEVPIIVWDEKKTPWQLCVEFYMGERYDYDIRKSHILELKWNHLSQKWMAHGKYVRYDCIEKPKVIGYYRRGLRDGWWWWDKRKKKIPYQKSVYKQSISHYENGLETVRRYCNDHYNRSWMKYASPVTLPMTHAPFCAFITATTKQVKNKHGEFNEEVDSIVDLEVEINMGPGNQYVKLKQKKRKRKKDTKYKTTFQQKGRKKVKLTTKIKEEE